MNTIKKIKILFVLIFVLASVSTQPMGQFARKAFPKACTVASWAIAAGPTTYDITKGLIGQKNNSKTERPKADLQIINLVNSHWKKRGNSGTVKVTATKHLDEVDESNFVCLANWRELITSKKNDAEVAKIVAKIEANKPLLPEEQHKLQATLVNIEHEFGHLENDFIFDSACLATPVVTHYGLKAIKNKLFTPAKAAVVTNLLKIPGALPKLLINTVAIKLIDKAREQVADERTPDNIELLKAAHTFFDERAHKDIQAWEEQNVPIEFFERFPLAHEIMYEAEVHPSAYFRAKRFEQRIKKLEQKLTKVKLESQDLDL